MIKYLNSCNFKVTVTLERKGKRKNGIHATQDIWLSQVEVRSLAPSKNDFSVSPTFLFWTAWWRSLSFSLPLLSPFSASCQFPLPPRNYWEKLRCIPLIYWIWYFMSSSDFSKLTPIVKSSDNSNGFFRLSPVCNYTGTKCETFTIVVFWP